MKPKLNALLIPVFLLASVSFCLCQSSYNYYNNPEIIGSKNPQATEPSIDGYMTLELKIKFMDSEEIKNENFKLNYH